MDEADLGNISMEQSLAREIARCRREAAGGTALAECEDCGEPIPEALRRAVPGCRLCVECQAEVERCR